MWREDSGYYNEAAFDLYSEHDATFFAKAPMSAQRLGLVAQSRDLVWKQDKKTGYEYASLLAKTKGGTTFREVHKRKVKKLEQQLSLLGE